MDVRLIVGLEIHVQLRTLTKMFCGCKLGFDDPPNSNVCPVCLGLPGSLPVINEQAYAYAVQTALAWCATRPFMGSVIFGATSLEQLDVALGGAELTLSDEVMADLDAAHKAHPMPY